MKTKQIIDTLQEHNDWRRGKGKWSDSETADYFDTISEHTIGHTIDAAIERLHKLEQERDQARNIANYWRSGTSQKWEFPWEKKRK